MIGARMAITIGRIKSFFKGSHYVAESYTLKYNKTEKTYTVSHYTMTHDEKSQMDEVIAAKQKLLIQMAEDLKVQTESTTTTTATTQSPKMSAKTKAPTKKEKAEKWAADVEKNRQKQLAENKTKKPKAKKMDTNIDTENILKDIKTRGAYNGEVKPKTKKPKAVKVKGIKNNTD